MCMYMCEEREDSAIGPKPGGSFRVRSFLDQEGIGADNHFASAKVVDVRGGKL